MKKRLIPIVSISLLLASCSAAYRTGQTPDDIYYSSGATVAKAVVEENSVIEDESYGDDAYLRMKVRNHGKWNTIDDKDYWYGGYNSNLGYYNGYSAFSPYSYSYGLGYGLNSYALSPYSAYSGYGLGMGYSSYYYNSYYNPWGYNSMGYYPGGYYNPVVIVGGKYPFPVSSSSRPSLSGYDNKNYYRGSSKSNPSRQYQSIFNNGNNGRSNSNSNSTYDPPSRTFNSGSSSSGSSGSSGAGSSRSSGGGGSSRGGRGG